MRCILLFNMFRRGSRKFKLIHGYEGGQREARGEIAMQNIRDEIRDRNLLIVFASLLLYFNAFFFLSGLSLPTSFSANINE